MIGARSTDLREQRASAALARLAESGDRAACAALADAYAALATGAQLYATLLHHARLLDAARRQYDAWLAQHDPDAVLDAFQARGVEVYDPRDMMDDPVLLREVAATARRLAERARWLAREG